MVGWSDLGMKHLTIVCTNPKHEGICVLIERLFTSNGEIVYFNEGTSNLMENSEVILDNQRLNSTLQNFRSGGNPKELKRVNFLLSNERAHRTVTFSCSECEQTLDIHLDRLHKIYRDKCKSGVFQSNANVAWSLKDLRDSITTA